MQTLLVPQRRGGNQTLVVPHMPTQTRLPAPQHLQLPSHPNTAVIPNHSPQPKAPVYLKRITLTASSSSFPLPRLTHRSDSTRDKWMLTSGVDQGMWRETPWHSLRTLHHPPQPRGLSPHKGLPLVTFTQQLTKKKLSRGEES